MKKTFKVPKDYPFKEDLEKQRQLIKQTTRSVSIERITLTEVTDYLPLTFVKLFRNRNVLLPLSAQACKVLVYIALDLDYNSSVVILSPKLLSMNKNTFYRVIMELIVAGIIRKTENKRETYWVNLSLLSNGNPLLEG